MTYKIIKRLIRIWNRKKVFSRETQIRIYEKIEGRRPAKEAPPFKKRKTAKLLVLLCFNILKQPA
jgi:hypothetical protein